jgi:hydroxyethylthiazole kinase
MSLMPIGRPALCAPGLEQVVAAQAALRRRNPLVQCLTNTVSANFVANALLAVGAAPAMVDNTQEAALFAGIADAVLVNLGTPTDAQAASMALAAEAAHAAGKPWVLDPIGAGALPWRGGVAVRLLSYFPAVIRGNASEINGLAGLGGGARGVDSSTDPADAVPASVDLLEHATAVSASGLVDHAVGRVGEAGRIVLVRIAGGSSLLPRVTATGCALGALVAAYASVAPDPFTGLVAAHVHFSVAAEIAAKAASRPGSFAPAFLDALDAVDEDALRAMARIAAPEAP